MDVDYVNLVALQLAGRSLAEAKEIPLDRIFNVISEDTRQPIEDPALHCTWEGTAIAIRDHPLLICRNKRELAVEDSAAPIRDRNGDIVGAVVVFRDVGTARKMTFMADQPRPAYGVG